MTQPTVLMTRRAVKLKAKQDAKAARKARNREQNLALLRMLIRLVRR